jgi:hypothetical protein
MKGELTLAALVTLIVGLIGLTVGAELVTIAAPAIQSASESLPNLGIGGVIGAVILTFLFGIVIGLGIARLGGEAFGFKIGF